MGDEDCHSFRNHGECKNVRGSGAWLPTVDVAGIPSIGSSEATEFMASPSIHLASSARLSELTDTCSRINCTGLLEVTLSLFACFSGDQESVDETCEEKVKKKTVFSKKPPMKRKQQQQPVVESPSEKSPIEVNTPINSVK